jgi:hypothetical protein
VAGRLVDRVGPLRVVVGAKLLQALGAVAYLAARGRTVVVTAAVLLAAGRQLFYSSLCALICDVAGDGPKDRPFAVAAMVRAGCFSLGGLAAGGLLSVAGVAGYRIAVVADAVSFAVYAAPLALLVRVPRPRRRDPRTAGSGAGRLWADRPFLAVIAATGLAALSVDFFLSGMSVYVLGDLHARPWLPGAALAGLLFQRASALAEAVAPAAVRGRYLAAFQYAFTVPGVIAPAMVALYSVAAWLPWLLVGASAGLAILLLHWLAGRLAACARGRWCRRWPRGTRRRPRSCPDPRA